MAKSLRILTKDGFSTRGRELTWEEVDQNFIDLDVLPDPIGNNNKVVFVSGDTYVLKENEGGSSAIGSLGVLQLSDGSGNLITGDTLVFDTINKTLVINDTSGALNTSFIIKGQGDTDSTINFLIKNSTNNTLFSFLDNGTLNMGTQIGAFIPPRVSGTDSINAPINGMLVYNMLTNTFQGYQGGNWDDISGGAGVPILIPGGITFGGVGGVISQDSDNLFFDNSTNRLGIGINTPLARLQIQGEGDTISTTALSVRNSSSTNLLEVLDNGNININGVLNTNNNNLLNVSNLSIGTATIASNSNKTLTMINGATLPSPIVVDTFSLYANDSGIANSSPFFLTENGTIIDLYKLYTNDLSSDNIQTLTVLNNSPTTSLVIDEKTKIIKVTLQGNWNPLSITGFKENKYYIFKFFTDGLNPFPWQVTFPTDIQRNDGVEIFLKHNTTDNTRFDKIVLLGKETTTKAQITESVTYG